MKNSKIKRALLTSIAVFAILVFAVVGIVVLNNRDKSNNNGLKPNAKVWDGVSKVAPVGTGTESDPFVIQTPANLAYVAQEMEYKYYFYILANDLDMGGHDWTPIGREGNYFQGEFEGDFHTIKNIGEDQAGYYSDSSKQAPSLFGRVKNAVIQELTVDYAFDKAVGTSAFGGIAQFVYGETLIKRCLNETDSITFENCSSTMGYGGLIGYATNRFLLDASYSLMNLKVAGAQAYAGGLVGAIARYDGTVEEYPEIKDSYYAGKIENINDLELANADIRIGEIVGDGYQENAENNVCTLSNVFSLYNIGSDTQNNVSDFTTGYNWVFDPSIGSLPVLNKVNIQAVSADTSVWYEYDSEGYELAYTLGVQVTKSGTKLTAKPKAVLTSYKRVYNADDTGTTYSGYTLSKIASQTITTQGVQSGYNGNDYAFYGFDASSVTYKWTNSSGTSVGTSDTYTASSEGTYTVTVSYSASVYFPDSYSVPNGSYCTKSATVSGATASQSVTSSSSGSGSSSTLTFNITTNTSYNITAPSSFKLGETIEIVVQPKEASGYLKYPQTVSIYMGSSTSGSLLETFTSSNSTYESWTLSYSPSTISSFAGIYITAGNVNTVGISYEVAYNANGGTGTMANSSHVYGTTSNLSANSFSRNGYDFSGWASISTGSVEYADQASVLNLVSTHGATYTLYAVWTAADPDHTITLDANGGTGGTSSVFVYFGKTLSTITPPTRDGYTFKGYYDNTEGTGTQYYNAQGVSSVSLSSATVSTLYAKWEVGSGKQYTVNKASHIIANSVGYVGTPLTITGGEYFSGNANYMAAVIYVYGGTSSSGDLLHTFDNTKELVYPVSFQYTMKETDLYYDNIYIDVTFYIGYFVTVTDYTGTPQILGAMYQYNSSGMQSTTSSSSYAYDYWLEGYVSGSSFYPITSAAFTARRYSGTFTTRATYPSNYCNPVLYGGSLRLSIQFYVVAGANNLDIALVYGDATTTYTTIAKDNENILAPTYRTTGVVYAAAHAYYANGYYYTPNTVAISTATSSTGSYTTRSTLTMVNNTYYMTPYVYISSSYYSLSNSSYKYIKLTSTWTRTANTYELYYCANDGTTTNKTSAGTMTYDTSFTIAENTFTRSGYTFLGWSTTMDGDVEYQAGDTLSNMTEENGDLAYLFAVWKADVEYTITLNSNGGTGGTTSIDIQGLDVGLPKIIVPTREGYNFSGYFTATTGGTQYYDAEGNGLLTVSFTTDQTFYAQWEKLVAITLDVNGGDSQNVTFYVNVGDTLPDLANLPYDDLYYFAGYFENNDGTGTQYYDAEGNALTAWSSNSDGTIYAHWVPGTYTIVYNANGGTGTMANSTHTQGVEQTLNKNAFSKEGYRFAGWSTTMSGGVIYTNEQSVVDLMSENNGIFNLYAVWESSVVSTVVDQVSSSWVDENKITWVMTSTLILEYSETDNLTTGGVDINYNFKVNYVIQKESTDTSGGSTSSSTCPCCGTEDYDPSSGDCSYCGSQVNYCSTCETYYCDSHPCNCGTGTGDTGSVDSDSTYPDWSDTTDSGTYDSDLCSICGGSGCDYCRDVTGGGGNADTGGASGDTSSTWWDGTGWVTMAGIYGAQYYDAIGVWTGATALDGYTIYSDETYELEWNATDDYKFVLSATSGVANEATIRIDRLNIYWANTTGSKLVDGPSYSVTASGTYRFYYDYKIVTTPTGTAAESLGTKPELVHEKNHHKTHNVVIPGATTIPDCNVTFNLGSGNVDGSSIIQESLTQGSAIPEYDVVAPTGYTFMGWSFDIQTDFRLGAEMDVIVDVPFLSSAVLYAWYGNTNYNINLPTGTFTVTTEGYDSTDSVSYYTEVTFNYSDFITGITGSSVSEENVANYADTITIGLDSIYNEEYNGGYSCYTIIIGIKKVTISIDGYDGDVIAEYAYPTNDITYNMKALGDYYGDIYISIEYISYQSDEVILGINEITTQEQEGYSQFNVADMIAVYDSSVSMSNYYIVNATNGAENYFVISKNISQCEYYGPTGSFHDDYTLIFKAGAPVGVYSCQVGLSYDVPDSGSGGGTLGLDYTSRTITVTILNGEPEITVTSSLDTDTSDDKITISQVYDPNATNTNNVITDVGSAVAEFYDDSATISYTITNANGDYLYFNDNGTYAKTISASNNTAVSLVFVNEGNFTLGSHTFTITATDGEKSVTSSEIVLTVEGIEITIETHEDYTSMGGNSLSKIYDGTTAYAGTIYAGTHYVISGNVSDFSSIIEIASQAFDSANVNYDDNYVVVTFKVRDAYSDYATIKEGETIYISGYIQAKSISNAVVGGDDHYYNGYEHIPDIYMDLDGDGTAETKLYYEGVSSDDYSISLTDNISAGTATATLSGYNNYTGTATLKFEIKPFTVPADRLYVIGLDQEGVEVDWVVSKDYGNTVGQYEWTGSEIKINPQIVQVSPYLCCGQNEDPPYWTLEAEEHYSMSYSNNTNVSTETNKATATIKFKGNYTGTFSVEYEILATQLAAPTNLTWNVLTASWDAVENASSYVIELYENGTLVSTTTNVKGTSHTFTNEIDTLTTYEFKVKAIGEDNYEDSAAATSGTIYAIELYLPSNGELNAVELDILLGTWTVIDINDKRMFGVMADGSATFGATPDTGYGVYYYSINSIITYAPSFEGISFTISGIGECKSVSAVFVGIIGIEDNIGDNEITITFDSNNQVSTTKADVIILVDNGNNVTMPYIYSVTPSTGSTPATAQLTVLEGSRVVFGGTTSDDNGLIYEINQFKVGGINQITGSPSSDITVIYTFSSTGSYEIEYETALRIIAPPIDEKDPEFVPTYNEDTDEAVFENDDVKITIIPTYEPLIYNGVPYYSDGENISLNIEVKNSKKAFIGFDVNGTIYYNNSTSVIVFNKLSDTSYEGSMIYSAEMKDITPIVKEVYTLSDVDEISVSSYTTYLEDELGLSYNISNGIITNAVTGNQIIFGTYTLTTSGTANVTIQINGNTISGANGIYTFTIDGDTESLKIVIG